jgi:hypothetical protein
VQLTVKKDGWAEGLIELVGLVALGLGGSLLASALVARIVSRQVFGIDITEAIEALRGSSLLSRSNQSLDITISRHEDEIRVSAEHRFDLLAAFPRRRRVPFQIYTDIARWGSAGGFDSIVEPDATVLVADDLAQYVTSEAGKARFEKAYVLFPGKPATFIVVTYGHFRCEDRLIWTVEHISSDFQVRVNDCTGLSGSVDVKINHHREPEIAANMARRRSHRGEVFEFEFLGEILPFQGFELQWSFAST